MKQYLNLLGKKSKKAFLDKINRKTKNKVLDNFASLINKKRKLIILQNKKDIKNASIEIAISSVEHLLKNSLDKSKLDKIYLSSLEETKLALKKKSS